MIIPMFLLILLIQVTVSAPLLHPSSTIVMRLPYRSQMLRPLAESQRRTKFARSIGEYESDRQREKSKAQLEKLSEILQESINQKADSTIKEIKDDIQSSRNTLSRLLNDFSNWNNEKTLIYRPG